MLRYPEWIDWCKGKQRGLWIHGIPGAGKTVLMSYLVEQIKEHCDQSQQAKTACVHYYCYFGRGQDEAVPFLRWMVSQLCRKVDWISSSVHKMYKQGGEPSLVELLRALTELLERFDTVYVAVDAIDESLPRDDLLKVFRDFATDSRFDEIRFLASSREYIDIERVMEGISVPISMANSFVEDDIRLHVRSLLKSNVKFQRWSQELPDEVQNAVSTCAKGMYVTIHSVCTQTLSLTCEVGFAGQCVSLMFSKSWTASARSSRKL